MTNWEDNGNLSSYNYVRSCRRIQRWPILWSFSIWSKLERWKSLISGCLISWPKIKKKKSFWSIIFFCSVQQWWTISWSDCNVRRKVDFIWQLVTISLVVRLRRSSKAFSKPNFHQKEIMVTVWWSALSLIHYSFLNPSEIITFEKYIQQMDELHQRLHSLQPALVNRKGPILLHDNSQLHVANQCFKNWINWATRFASSAIFTWPLAHWPPLLQASRQLFSGKMLPHFPHRKLSKSSLNPKTWIFFAAGIKKLISCWQKCVDCNGSSFD